MALVSIMSGILCLCGACHNGLNLIRIRVIGVLRRDYVRFWWVIFLCLVVLIVWSFIVVFIMLMRIVVVMTF